MFQISEKQSDRETFSPSRIETAHRRLDTAFEQLERVVSGMISQKTAEEADSADSVKIPRREYSHLRKEIDELRNENEKLMKLLHETEDNYAKLKRVSKNVSGKVNNSIGKLKFILEG